MPQSPFDPATFLDRSTEGVTLDTKRTAYPEGWKQVNIVRVGDAQGKARTSDDGRPIVDVRFEMVGTIPKEVTEQMGERDKYTIDNNYWLDITPEGGLDFGPNKNTDLGALLDALGMNDGRAWSFRQLVGQGPLWIRTGIRATADGGQFTRVVEYSAEGPESAAA